MFQEKIKNTGVKILLADDDQDDCELTIEAFQDNPLWKNRIDCVNDGQELLDYLRKKGRYLTDENHSIPQMILLDLNMPRKDGREALREIKTDPVLCKIPVIILTTSSSRGDIDTTYQLGANSYVTKPKTYKGMVELTRIIHKYWLECSALPSI